MSKLFKLFLFPLVALAIVCQPDAFAQGKKKKTIGDILKKIEKKAKRVDIKKGRSALPKFQKKRQVPRRVNLGQVKPPTGSSLYYEEGTDEAQLEKILDEGIEQLFTLTRRFKKSRKRGELWLRLAELYVEKSRLIEYRLQNEYDKALQEYFAKKRKRKPKLNLAAANDYNKKAIQLYEWFLRDFPKDPKIDQALFFLGYNYFELGNVEKGTRYYKQLTKQFPRSNYVEESNFALGEFYFENEKWKDARVYFAKVAKNKRSRLFSFALYKMAWCEYKSGQATKGLKSLERVIFAGRKSKGSGEKTTGGLSKIRLASEAIKDLVLFYGEANSDGEGYKRSRAYFRKVVGRKNLNKVLEKLAYYYVDTGNRSRARFVFRDIIADNPNTPKAYDYQYQIVNMYAAAGNNKVFRKELFLWIERYGPESVWYRANAKRPGLVKKSNELIETTLRNYVLQQHQTAQNSRAKYSQGLAKEGYELYFNTFNNTKKIDEMHFFYGELLFDMKLYEKAAFHYLKVSEVRPKSSYKEKANLNALLALEKELPSEAKIKKIVGDSLEPVEFDRTIRVFISVSKRYLKAYPKGENAVAIRYKIGSLHYYYNQFDKALVIFNEIITNHPRTKYAKISANLILDIYNLKKDYVGLENAAAKILSIKPLAKGALKDQVQAIKAQTGLKMAEQMAKGNNYSESAVAFEKFARANPGTPSGIDAAFNAGVNYVRVDNLVKGIAMYALVLKSRDPSKKDLRKKAQRFVAELYEKTGQYAKAATAFESFAQTYPKEPISNEFIFNAAAIRDGMQYYTGAIKNYERYLKVSKKKDRWEVYYLIGRIWEKRGKRTKAIQFYKKYFRSQTPNQAGLVEAGFRLAKLYEAQKDKVKSTYWLKATVEAQRNFSKRGKKVGVSYAAEAKFKLVYNSTFKKMRDVKFPRSSQGQAKAFNTKDGLLRRLQKDLEAVIAYDDGVMVVASLTLLGQAFQHFAAAFVKAPIPKEVTKDILAQYKEGVKGKAAEYQGQAVKFYQNAIDKGVEIEAYSPYFKVAMKEINRIDKTKYPDYGFDVFLTKKPDWMGYKK